MSTDSKILKLKIPVKNTYQRVSLWNGIYNLTNKEINVLSYLIDTIHKEFCSKPHREDTAKVLDMSVSGLNTYIKRLKDKGAITQKDGNYIYSKLFLDLDGVEISILRRS
jgi:DNA-binding MarR family transcriptional regulator